MGAESRLNPFAQSLLRLENNVGVEIAKFLRRYGPLLIGIAATCLVFVLIRGGWLLSANMLNPDEAQLLAAGKQARVDFVPYHTYTTYTYLFFWPIFLGFVNLVGIPLNFTTAHVISALFDIFVVVTGWHLIARWYGWRLASVLVLPTAIYYFADANQQHTSIDLYSLTTESLPIVLIFVGLAVLTSAPGSLSTRRFILGSAICGLAPWAKPQLGPLALAVVYSCSLIRATEVFTNDSQARTQGNSRFRVLAKELAIGTVSFVGPSLIVIAFIASVGEFGNFVRLGLGGTSGVFSYISAMNASENALSARIFALVHYLEQFHVVLYWALAGILGWRAIAGSDRRWLNALRVLIWALPLLAAVATLAILPEDFLHFLHYSNVLFAGALASAVLGANTSRFSSHDIRSDRWRKRVIAALALAASVSIFLDSGSLNTVDGSTHFAESQLSSLVTRGRLVPDDAYNPDGSALTTMCPQASRVFVFGWANELYSYYDWMPADEFLVENWGIPRSGPALTASDLIATELKQVPPRCIVEAIGTGFFGFIPSTDTIERVVPEIKQLLRTCYRRRSTNVGTAVLGWTGEAGQTVTYWTRRSACA